MIKFKMLFFFIYYFVLYIWYTGMLQMWYSYGFIENGILKCNWNVEYFLVSISLSKWEFKSYLLPDKGIEHRSVRRTLSSLSWGLKKYCPFLISYRPCPAQLHATQKIFMGLRGIWKNSTKHTFFLSNLAFHYHVFLFRMYFCNSIIILHGATTYMYFIWHAWFKFSCIPLLTQR